MREIYSSTGMIVNRLFEILCHLIDNTVSNSNSACIYE